MRRSVQAPQVERDAEVGLSKKLFQNELSHFSLPGYFRNRLAGTKISVPPLFIVGCGHSGTTMLRHVLGMHSRLYAVPYESRIFFHSRSKIALADWVWSLTAISLGKSRWVEKTPSHIHRMAQILKAYPDARILLLIRDGRNVAISLRKRWGDFERSVSRWVEDNRAGEPYWNHPNVMVLKYEDLVSNFEGEMREICDFIGEPFEDVFLNFTRPAEVEGGNGQAEAHSPDGAQPRELRDRQISRGLYGAEERWRQQMTDEERSQFKAIAGDMLVEYGYASDKDW